MPQKTPKKLWATLAIMSCIFCASCSSPKQPAKTVPQKEIVDLSLNQSSKPQRPQVVLLPSDAL